MKIAIVDYGVGNLHSVVKALKLFTNDLTITEEASEIKSADAVVLPGVGSFESGMRGLEVRGLTDTIKECAALQKPMLGICLGAQLMLSEGHEFGVFEGLNIIKGKVVKFPKLADSFKVPHIGWNAIYPPQQNVWRDTILSAMPQNPALYFVHSYILSPADKASILALSNYGEYEFCAAIRQGSIYGCQFHPEKSGKLGLKIIKEFIKRI